MFLRELRAFSALVMIGTARMRAGNEYQGRNRPMNAQSPAIRELSLEECDSTAGGIWGPLMALGAAALAGVGLAIVTAPDEEVSVPVIDIPVHEEPAF
jgi:hypothetical protein